jgi:hypothetical protein
MRSAEQHKMEQFLDAIPRAIYNVSRVFRTSDVCHWLQWDHDECDRVTGLLEKAGLLNRLPNGEAILTSAGLRRIIRE